MKKHRGKKRVEPQDAEDVHPAEKMTRKVQHRIHERWVEMGMAPDLRGGDRRRYLVGKQCLHCVSYVPLLFPLGADWGACTGENSGEDGKIVFEHHTCPAFQVQKDS